MKYLILFLTFAKIGMFTIGGGYAMIPLIEREIVNKKWMTKNDFMEMFALTQSLPGVFAVNISIFVGYKLHKVKGSLVCALATILPSFVIMMLIAMFFARFQDNQTMIRIFNGIRPAVVALIVFPCISAVRALKLKYWQLVLPAITTLLIWQCGLSPVYIVLAGIAGGLIYTLWLKDKLTKLQA
ncbi:chromate transporter [Bacteroides eggerthii]|uniref:chromate transporter n=1 Tax=Bacteroides eggerthii TaxID=28111 RepID=UPI0022E0B43A|nr:chromate transporter [Bacteroides eggerthii]